MRRRAASTVAVALASVILLGCGDEDPATGVAEPALEGDITVFAAASLTDAFTELRSVFEQTHPEASVAFNFGPSSGLATQITEGAPADVFASASTSQMDVVVEAGANEGEPTPFVTNVLQIAVPPDNPGAVGGLGDFARDELLIGLCAEEVPCGQFARQALLQSGVTPAIDTYERDVRALLTKVEAGELDAAIVYETDVLSSGGAVAGVDIPEGQNVIVTYPLVALAEAGAPEVAAAFVELVLSDEGLQILESYGFGAP